MPLSNSMSHFMADNIKSSQWVKITFTTNTQPNTAMSEMSTSVLIQYVLKQNGMYWSYHLND